MGKVHTLTAKVTIGFLLIILPMILYPVLFKDQTFNEMYDSYKGLIWFVGFLGVLGLSVLTYINGVYQNELKDCAQKGNKKSEQIEEQNEKLLVLQEKMVVQSMRSIEQLENVHDAIRENTKKDQATVEALNKLSGAVDKFGLRLAHVEKKVDEHSKILKI